jgi:hypothetical protein
MRGLPVWYGRDSHSGCDADDYAHRERELDRDKDADVVADVNDDSDSNDSA